VPYVPVTETESGWPLVRLLDLRGAAWSGELDLDPKGSNPRQSQFFISVHNAGGYGGFTNSIQSDPPGIRYEGGYLPFADRILRWGSQGSTRTYFTGTWLQHDEQRLLAVSLWPGNINYLGNGWIVGVDDNASFSGRNFFWFNKDPNTGQQIAGGQPAWDPIDSPGISIMEVFVVDELPPFVPEPVEPCPPEPGWPYLDPNIFAGPGDGAALRFRNRFS
jgi:hypothetical protein